jgi:hypothetical protein
MKKETLDLLNSIMSDNGEPYFSKEYIENTFLGINSPIRWWSFYTMSRLHRRNPRKSRSIQTKRY